MTSRDGFADQRHEGAQEWNRLPHDESADVDVSREVKEGGRGRRTDRHRQQSARRQGSARRCARVREWVPPPLHHVPLWRHYYLEHMSRGTESMTDKHKKVIGRVETDLDGRFSEVRTRETNLGNQPRSKQYQILNYTIIKQKTLFIRNPVKFCLFVCLFNFFLYMQRGVSTLGQHHLYTMHVHIMVWIVGNFIADMMLSAVHADATLLNGGTLRSDRIHPAGNFRMKDLVEILPFGGNVCLLEVTGARSTEWSLISWMRTIFRALQAIKSTRRWKYRWRSIRCTRVAFRKWQEWGSLSTPRNLPESESRRKTLSSKRKWWNPRKLVLLHLHPT